MKWFFKMMLPALVLVSCSKEGGSPVEVSPVSTKENVEVVAHDVIELGRKLENPYSVTNVGKALAALYPTRGEVSVPVTDYYVRFLQGHGAVQSSLGSWCGDAGSSYGL